MQISYFNKADNNYHVYGWMAYGFENVDTLLTIDASRCYSNNLTWSVVIKSNLVVNLV
jgi:hypothetical protein